MELDDKLATRPISSWDECANGLLFIEVTALSGGVFKGGAFSTDSAPARDVRLGVVITHFNRQRFAAAAVERLTSGRSADPELKRSVGVFVVDNSRNLEVPSTQQVTVIPNENYGGSGGFTRGLLEVMDDGSYTHCLFMDDDASCHVESIRRTIVILSRTRSERCAVAGTMLLDHRPTVIHEKGGYFHDGSVHPPGRGLDIRHCHDVLMSERAGAEANYGGWWYFAFNLAEVRSFPFPFFVKGDDQLFPMMNNLQILTVNGICSWCEDFERKDTPFSRYLYLRSQLMLIVYEGKVTRLKLLYLLLSLLGDTVLRHRYATVTGMAMAIEDIVAGPAIWESQINGRDLISRFADLQKAERFENVVLAKLNVTYARYHRSRIIRLARYLFGNGLLLPKFLASRYRLLELIGFRSSFLAMFRYSEILYYDPATQRGFVAKQNRLKAFSVSARYITALVRLIAKFDAVTNNQRQAIGNLATEQFWRRLYNIPLRERHREAAE